MMVDNVQMQPQLLVFQTACIVLMVITQIWWHSAKITFTARGVWWQSAGPVQKTHCIMDRCVFLLSYSLAPLPLQWHLQIKETNVSLKQMASTQNIPVAARATTFAWKEK
jgi:hypothetical protein